jgi:hypothetical protein
MIRYLFNFSRDTTSNSAGFKIRACVTKNVIRWGVGKKLDLDMAEHIERFNSKLSTCFKYIYMYVGSGDIAF